MKSSNWRGLLVCSFKGGVGKTTIVAALARQLPGKVACLDMDWNNPVLNLALGIDHARHLPLRNFRIAPVDWERGQFASIGFLTIPGGILRQSPERREALIGDFISSLAWEPFDWLLVDTGPVGEELSPLIKMLDPEVVVVSEPGPLAHEGAVRTILFLEAIRAKLLGVVGNKGLRAEGLCEELGVPCLGSVPLAGVVTVPDFTRFVAKRLGEVSWGDKIRRGAVKLGLEVLLKEG